MVQFIFLVASMQVKVYRLQVHLAIKWLVKQERKRFGKGIGFVEKMQTMRCLIYFRKGLGRVLESALGSWKWFSLVQDIL